MGWFIFALLVFSIIGNLIRISNEEKAEKQKKQKKQCKAEKEKHLKNRLSFVFSERERKYGQLTKTISYSQAEKNMQIYENSKIIFIEGKPYSFSDVVSCKIETSTIKGKETHVTTPDKNNKYNMQALYGKDWAKHVTKFNTEIVKEPDRTYYTVYIGLNNLSKPLVEIKLGENKRTANEICSILNVLINNNQK